MNICNKLRSRLAIFFAINMVFSVASFAGDKPQLLGKDLGQNRDLVMSTMHGRNYVVELDQQGKIKQIVDSGANGDGTEAPDSENIESAVAAKIETTTTTVSLPENHQGQAAIDYMGADLPKIAADYGLTPDKLEDLLLTDNTARIDNNKHLFYVDESIENQAGIEIDAAGTANSETSADNSSVPIASTASLANTFKLHSKPGASKTIYLDFDGHVASGTAWSSSTIVAPAYDLGGDPAVFDNNELSNIISIWNRVSEDYIPFDVDVTTEQPTNDALLRNSAADTVYGTRVVITKTGTITCTCGGIAYVGVVSMVNNAAYQPAWVFQQSLANNEKYIAEAVAHEAGHTLGLTHDGQINGATVTSYYGGHGSGTTAWAPIMGVSYYKNLTQWSSGIYPGANNQQDDIAVLASKGIFSRADDVGNIFSSAKLLSNVVTGATVSTQAFGVIETSSDVDIFAVNSAGGLVNLKVSPAATGPNLDTQLTLYKSDGTVLASSAPEGDLSATISVYVPAGTHFMAVSSSAHALAGTDYGYPTYGSLGQYKVTATYATGGISIPSAPMPTQVAPTPVNVTPAPTPTSTQPSVHAALLKMDVKKGNKVNARVTIKVTNNQGSVIPNAVVKGAWSGAFSGKLIDKTSKSGVVIDTPNAPSSRKGGSGTFTIKSITAPGYTYNSDQNEKTVTTVTW